MNERFSRQSFLGPSSEKALATLSIGIVGLGGGGSHVVQQLAHLGVGGFTLLDPDCIDSSNLNRLIGGTERDVGKKKTKVSIANRLVKAINPKAIVIAKSVKWQESAEHLRDCDVIVGCVDSFAGRDELERMARRFIIPYVDIGMDVHESGGRYSITGQVAVSLPDGPCLHCMSVLTPDLLSREAAQYGQAGPRPQVVWPNGILASVAVGLVVALVTPWDQTMKLPRLVEYDGNVPEVRPSSSASFLADRQCPHFNRPEDIGDPWFQLKAED